MLLSNFPEEAGNLISGIPAVVIVAVDHCHRMATRANDVPTARKSAAKLIDRYAFRAALRQQKRLGSPSHEITTPYRVRRRHISFHPPNVAEVIVDLIPSHIIGETNRPNHAVRDMLVPGIGIDTDPHDQSPSFQGSS